MAETKDDKGDKGKEEPKAKESGGKDKGDEGKKKEEKPKPRPVLIFEGSLEDAKFMVSVPGATIPKDTKATISAGHASNPKRGMFKLGAEGMGLKFDADGVARGEGDLSKGALDATHAVGQVPGFGDSDAVRLPPRKLRTDDLEVEAALFPDAQGDFLVTVITRRDGQFASRAFRAVPNADCALLDSNKQPLPNLATPAEGKLSIYVRLAAGVYQVRIRFVLVDGTTEKTINLVKVMPRPRRSR